MFSDKERPEYLALKLKEQRWLFLACTLFLLVLFSYVAVALNKVVSAKDLLARGLPSTLPGAQAELDVRNADNGIGAL
jgi:hypothetical protein